MRFLADMGVSNRVVQWLRERGHDAMHLREQGLQRMPNGDIFQKAFAEQRNVLTFDLDFGEILAGSKGKIVSVILFRMRNTRTEQVIDRLSSVIERAEKELTEGAIIVVEDTRFRIRRLPIGNQGDPSTENEPTR